MTVKASVKPQGSMMSIVVKCEKSCILCGLFANHLPVYVVKGLLNDKIDRYADIVSMSDSVVAVKTITYVSLQCLPDL